MTPAMTPGVSTLRRRLILVFIAVPLLVATACAQFQDATGWDDPKAKRHFVEACVGDTRVGDGSTTVVERAPENYCECVFDDLKNVHKLDWEVMRSFEESLAKVSAGNPPDVPTEVKKAMEACDRANTVGPEAPGSGEDSTTTTEAAGSN